VSKSTARNTSAPGRSALKWALKLLLPAVMAALVGAAVWFGSRKLWRGVVHRPEFQVVPVALSLNGFPDWIDGARMTDELRRELGRLPRTNSLFRKDLAHAVRHELRASPWVLDVTRVERQLPNTLAVKASFRKPMGQVLFADRLYMVDGDGHWLPEELFKPPLEWGELPSPVIRDSLLNEPPPTGACWDGPRLAAGARLTDFLRREGLLARLRIETIDVTGVGRDAAEPDIVLTAAGGAQIKWGKSSVYDEVPGVESAPHLVPDSEKLAMLLSKLDHYPGLQGIRYVDLRFHGKVFFAERG